MERIQASNRVAYILYSDKMAYLATLSWFKGHLIYETHQPEMVDISATQFEENALQLDRGAEFGQVAS